MRCLCKLSPRLFVDFVVRFGRICACRHAGPLLQLDVAGFEVLDGVLEASDFWIEGFSPSVSMTVYGPARFLSRRASGTVAELTVCQEFRFQLPQLRKRDWLGVSRPILHRGQVGYAKKSRLRVDKRTVRQAASLAIASRIWLTLWHLGDGSTSSW